MPPPVLLERDAERDRILEALAAAADGETRLVVVEAAAGLGKTALLQDVARAAPDAPRRLAARPGEHEAGYAYGVLRQLLAAPVAQLAPQTRAQLATGATGPALRVLQEAPDPAPPVDAAFGVVDAFYWLVADLALRAPLALIVDDAQWADPPSLRFLGHLLRRLDGLPVAIILALRPNEPGAPTELIDPLRLDPRADVVGLHPLSEGSVGWLVGSAGGDASIVRACHRACAGNPLYLRELLRMLEGEFGGLTGAALERVGTARPAAIARHARRQAARLGPAGARLADAAAVLGDGVALRDAAACAGLLPAEAADLAAALCRIGILAEPDPMRFEHPIVRAALEAEVAPGERIRLHRSAADVLAAADAPAERIAGHLVDIPPGSGIELGPLLRAAADATARGAPDVAANYLRRAVAEPPPPAERGTILHALGTTEEMLPDERCWAHLREAIVLAPDVDTRIAWTLELAIALAFRGEMGEAMPLVTDALAAARGPEERAWLAAHLCALAWGERDGHPLVPDLFARYAADLPADPAARRLLLGARAARMDLPADEVVLHAEQALGDEGFASGAWLGAMLAVGALIYTDRFAPAGDHLDDALALARAIGSRTAIGSVHAMHAELALATGDLARCETHARTFLGPLSGTDAAGRAYVTAVLVRALVDRGDLEAADAALSALGHVDDIPTSHVHYFLRAARGRLRCAQGRLEEGVADFAAARECLARFSATVWSPIGFDGAAEEPLALQRLGREEEARALVAASLGPARTAGPPRNRASTLRAAGILAGGHAGVELLEEAAAGLEGTGARLEQARTLVALGALRRIAGRRAAAREPLGRAFDLASDCGAFPLAARAREELAASGARPRRSRLTAGVDSLTPSEARMARMAAEGRSNREIAEELYVSLKTVEMHLSRAYRKLSIDGRSGLRAALGVTGESR